MTHPGDLAERIARLERLLDSLERSRPGAAERAPSNGSVPGAGDRLRELAAMLQERLTDEDLDEGDILAMRALLEECRSLTAELRAEASALGERLQRLAARSAEGHERLATLERL